VSTDTTWDRGSFRAGVDPALILASTGAAICAIDLEGRVAQVKPAAAGRLGMVEDEVIGQRLHHLVHGSRPGGSTYAPDECPLQVAMRDGNTHRVSDETFWRQDGSGFPVEYMSTPMLVDKRVVGAVLTFADITERREAEDAGLHQAAALRAQAELLDLAHDAIVVRDLYSGAIRYWNRGAEDQYGWTIDEAMGQRAHTLLRTEFPESIERVEEVLTRTGAWEGELVHRTRSGRRLVVASRWAVQKDAEGRPKAYLEINTDVTERKRHEQEQAELLKQAEAAEARFRGLVESAPDPVVIVDSEGRIELINEQTQALFGYVRHELVGQPVELLLPQRFRAAHLGHRATYQAEPHTRTVGAGLDLYARRKDGSEFPAEISLGPWGSETASRW